MSSTDNRKFKSAEGRREASAAEQLPPSANQRSPMIQLGLKKKEKTNVFTKKKLYEERHEEWKRTEDNGVLFHMVPPVCRRFSSFQAQINRNKWGFPRRTFIQLPLCVRSFYLSVQGIRGKEKGNARHITSINYRRNRRPERKRRYFFHHCTIVLGLEVLYQSILHYS